jgi:hypothetical protein
MMILMTTTHFEVVAVGVSILLMLLWPLAREWRDASANRGLEIIHRMRIGSQLFGLQRNGTRVLLGLEDQVEYVRRLRGQS